jgi:hypothetical protein
VERGLIKVKKQTTHEVSIIHFSFLDLIASWTVEIALDMYLSGNDDRLVEVGRWMEGFSKGF